MLERTEREIIQNWKGDISPPTVSICCITYNHEKYISEAIDSFLMQDTDFPFEIIIGEDCSKDGTREIIDEYQRKYPKLINLITSDCNIGAKGNFIRTMERCRGTYIAICEGDDYWIDPLKLQKQVDFLEKNADYGLVHTDYIIKNESDTLEKKRTRKRKVSNNLVKDLVMVNYLVGTFTVIFRKEIYKRIPKCFLSESFQMIDYSLWIEMATITKFKYFNDITTVYRILKNSMSHNVKKIIEWEEKKNDLRRFYIEKYDLDIDERTLQSKLCSEVIKLSYVHQNSKLGRLYLKRLTEINFLHILNIKNILFFLGSQSFVVRAMIKLLYRSS